MFTPTGPQNGPSGLRGRPAQCRVLRVPSCGTGAAWAEMGSAQRKQLQGASSGNSRPVRTSRAVPVRRLSKTGKYLHGQCRGFEGGPRPLCSQGTKEQAAMVGGEARERAGPNLRRPKRRCWCLRELGSLQGEKCCLTQKRRRQTLDGVNPEGWCEVATTVQMSSDGLGVVVQSGEGTR